MYLISIEDIILDRLRAGVHWQSEDNRIWGLKLLAGNYDSVDFAYLMNNAEVEEETELLQEWFRQIEDNLT